MTHTLDKIPFVGDVEVEDRNRLRRGLLLVEREKTRKQGERILEKMVERRDPHLSPVAMSGLASSAFWSGNIKQALYFSKLVVATFPFTGAAMWASGLLVTLYRMMGMRKERFEAERERLRIMKRIAFQSESRDDRIYALSELMKELEQRDLPDDAKRCAEELEDLIRSRPVDYEALDAFDINSTR